MRMTVVVRDRALRAEASTPRVRVETTLSEACGVSFLFSGELRVISEYSPDEAALSAASGESCAEVGRMRLLLTLVGMGGHYELLVRGEK